MTPAELHAWVVAQWQAKLDTARAATAGPWDFVPAPDGSWHIEPPDYAEPDVGQVAGHADAIHIAAFDPAFAIAACEAALLRLTRCAPAEDDERVWRCGKGLFAHPWPCLVVLDDAAPFADRPDFPEELKRP